MQALWSRSVIAILACLWAFGYCATVAAADTLVTLPSRAEDAENFAVSLARSADFLDDPNGTFTIDDVSREKQRASFGALPASYLTARHFRGWYRFRLVGTAESARRFALFANTGCETADLYVPRRDGTYGVIRFGMLVPNRQRRDPDVAAPFVPLEGQVLDGRPMYLFLSTNRVVLTPSRLFGIEPVQDVRAQARSATQIDDFFGGLFFAILTLNIFLWLYLRDRTFLVYVVAMAFHLLTQLTQDANAWRWIWPWASLPYLPVVTVAKVLFLSTLPLFWRMFLDLPRRYPRLDRVLLCSIALVPIYGVLNLTLPQPRVVDSLAFPLIFLSIGLSLYAAIRAMRDGYRPARFLIAALAGLFVLWVATFVQELVRFSLPFDGIEIGLFTGTSWDALVLTFALADRIQVANRASLEAQAESGRAKDALLAEQAESLGRLRERDVAVSRFLPQEFLERLGRGSVVDLQLGDHVECEMTILFSDIRSFTTISESLSPEDTFRLLNGYLRRAGPVIRENGGFVDKYIGDAIMGLFPREPHTAIDAAIGLQNRLHEFNQERAREGFGPIEIGVGLHRGTLMLGTIGESERIETTVIADAVNIASRTESLTKTFGATIIASAAVVDAIDRSRYRLRPLGAPLLKGATRTLAMYEVYDADPPVVLLQKNATLAVFTAGVEAFERGQFAAAGACFAEVTAVSPVDRVAASFAERCQSRA